MGYVWSACIDWLKLECELTAFYFIREGYVIMGSGLTGKIFLKSEQ